MPIWVRYAAFERIPRLLTEGWALMDEASPGDNFGMVLVWEGEGTPERRAQEEYDDARFGELADAMRVPTGGQYQ